MANVFDVANYILKSIGGEISTMKLQKLCYYCQAWHLAWHGVPFVPENFERWANGPVCRELYDMHKGWFSIHLRDIDLKLCSTQELEEKPAEHIDKILETYGVFNGAQLSEMTHREDPWKKTKRDAVIDDELMREFYGSIDYEKMSQQLTQ